MKIAFIINDIMSEKEDYTTICLAHKALTKGFDVSLVSLGDFDYCPNGDITAKAAKPRSLKYKNIASFLKDIQESYSDDIKVQLNKVDIIMLRADPADEVDKRPWAPNSSLLFSQLAAKEGVIVLNDPRHLTDASTKTYFQHYPKAIRPKTCITRDANMIKKFIEDEGGKAVIKPLVGSGGHGVFLVDKASTPNINQMIEATVKDGYAIVQEYLPKAAEGDLRVITLNGEILKVDGVEAVVHRFSKTEDMRSNISAGGGFEVGELPPEGRKVVELAIPQIKHDGMYLAGLDIVGDKMMEINVDSTGGIAELDELTGIDFSGAIIDDLIRKIEVRDNYQGYFSNSEISIL
jgi:glutathione synthase